MVYGVQAALAFSTAARRDAVQADITNRIADRPRWDATVITPVRLRFGANGLTVSTRFTTRTDAEDLNTQVQTFATGVRTPLPGSSLVVHDCTHDEGTNVCAIVSRRDW